MFTIGFIVTLVGVLGTIWARKTTLDWQNLIVVAFSGKVPLKIRMISFFYDYGFILIIVGVVLMVIGWKRYKDNK